VHSMLSVESINDNFRELRRPMFLLSARQRSIHSSEVKGIAMPVQIGQD
jgi:hypothetical protein